MQTLLINMASATDRLAFMAAQLDALELTWERIEAVTPDTLLHPADDVVWHRWERPLRDTEMAACASHMAAWTRVLELNRPCLILEDDALLDRAVPDLLARLSAGDLVYDHVSLETRGRKKSLARKAEPGLPLQRLYLDRTGAAAYVLAQSGARKLLDRAERARGLADGLICAAYEMRSFQADPALAIQLDQAAVFGLATLTQARSQIGEASKPGRGGPSFRLRRLRAQVIQGLRQLRPGTRRCLVPPAGNWVTTAADHADTRDAPRTSA